MANSKEPDSFLLDYASVTHTWFSCSCEPVVLSAGGDRRIELEYISARGSISPTQVNAFSQLH